MAKGGTIKWPSICPYCAARVEKVGRSNWGRHILRHTQKVKQELEPEGLMEEVLDISQGPLAPLTTAFRSAIRRSEGLTTLPASEAVRLWQDLFHDGPALYPASECWVKKPAYDDLLNELVHEFDKRETKVYVRGRPHFPCEDAPFIKVLQQLQDPDASLTYYATNMSTRVAQMRMPERFIGTHPYYMDNDIVTSINVTPKYTFVDLHIDHGKYVVTTSYGGCVKLWAAYPLTNENRRLYGKECAQNDIFIRLHDKLERGVFLITTDDVAIKLPPGCLHATLTLRGGVVPGFEYTTASCLRMSAAVWDLHSAEFQMGRDGDVPLFEALIMAWRSDHQEIRAEACQIMCPRWKTLNKSKCPELSKLKKLCGLDCQHCGKPWKVHV
ncbi:hypothetical protein G7054_g14683 [Neopestalotiopsis clavispora]|nr:hypothetical protein G7054_g14683 [Neopestalotiopsis clavispora]